MGAGASADGPTAATDARTVQQLRLLRQQHKHALHHRRQPARHLANVLRLLGAQARWRRVELAHLDELLELRTQCRVDAPLSKLERVRKVPASVEAQAASAMRRAQCRQQRLERRARQLEVLRVDDDLRDLRQIRRRLDRGADAVADLLDEQLVERLCRQVSVERPACAMSSATDLL